MGAMGLWWGENESWGVWERLDGGREDVIREEGQGMRDEKQERDTYRFHGKGWQGSWIAASISVCIEVV